MAARRLLTLYSPLFQAAWSLPFSQRSQRQPWHCCLSRGTWQRRRPFQDRWNRSHRNATASLSLEAYRVFNSWSVKIKI